MVVAAGGGAENGRRTAAGNSKRLLRVQSAGRLSSTARTADTPVVGKTTEEEKARHTRPETVAARSLVGQRSHHWKIC